MQMTDTMYALLGVPLMFLITFVWCWVEDRMEKRARTKYDKQMAKYDQWMKSK